MMNVALSALCRPRDTSSRYVPSDSGDMTCTWIVVAVKSMTVSCSAPMNTDGAVAPKFAPAIVNVVVAES
jgi:hypothetical protein